MFIDVTRRRNPALIEAAVGLHRDLQIPSNCYVVDVDTVAANAQLLAEAGREHDVDLLQMTKQWGRNPLVARAVQDAGVSRAVAVDFDEARVLDAAGVNVAHLGHLVQVPAREVRSALRMAPDQITVQSLAQAQRLSDAAIGLGVEQALLLRVEAPGDVFYPGQRGAVKLDELERTAHAVQSLPGVSVAGVTTFPCLLWNPESGRLEPTHNLTTVSRSAELLRDAGMDIRVVNTPSATCIATLGTLAAAGSTQAEPGSGLLGQTPLHAVSDEPELPAMVYVTEVTHVDGSRINTLGGGFYPRSKAEVALVYGRRGEPIQAQVEANPPDAIDYHGTLLSDGSVTVGDTVVYAFRSQVFVSRSVVAVVDRAGTSPRVLGLFSRDGFALDDRRFPSGAPVAR